jgi:hypothetical protein
MSADFKIQVNEGDGAHKFFPAGGRIARDYGGSGEGSPINSQHVSIVIDYRWHRLRNARMHCFAFQVCGPRLSANLLSSHGSGMVARAFPRYKQ